MAIVYELDYENGNFAGTIDGVAKDPAAYWFQNAPTVESSPTYPVRVGNYAMRCYLHREESDFAYRTAIILGPDRYHTYNLTIGEEYWIGFSVYVPADMVVDPEGYTDIIFQIQAHPDDGESWRQPCFHIAINEDRWEIKSRWDTRAFSPGSGWEHSRDSYEFAMGDDIGKWTDWVIHIKLAYDDAGGGYTQVWRDGVQVVDWTGPNCANDQTGPQVSIGVYKWCWRYEYGDQTNSVWRLFYIDEMRVGDANASYGDVAPGGTGDVIPVGISSAEAFGTPTVTGGGATIEPQSITSVEAFGIPTVAGGSGALFNITHEIGTLGEYDDTETGGGDLSADADAGLGGTGTGLKCVINDTSALWGDKEMAAPSSQFRVRFYVDPNGLTMGSGDLFRILRLTLSVSPWYLAIVELGWDGTHYEIMLTAQEDDGTTHATAHYDITDAEHYVELRLVRATNGTSGDGTADLWIDGVHKEQITGLDNYDLFDIVEIVRLGPSQGLDATTSGTLYLDELKANSSGNEIGPTGGSYEKAVVGVLADAGVVVKRVGKVRVATL